jgi:TetR/AcrR family tetracycline transcriptional repressor
MADSRVGSRSALTPTNRGRSRASARPSRTSVAPLSTASIVDAACAIIAEGGTDALTMRALSDRLGVALGATYRHIPNRDALLLLVARELLGRVARATRDDDDWLDRMRTLALGYIDIFRTHPGMAAVVMANLPVIEAPELLGAISTAYDESGLDDDTAMTANMAVFFYVNAITASDLARAGDKPVDPRFADGLEILLKGIRAEAAERRRSRAR